jgi:hypothetical protein
MASHLNKHLLTPSISGIDDGSIGSPTPQGGSEDLALRVAMAGKARLATVRRSPPLRTDEYEMPKVAVISSSEPASLEGADKRTPEIRGRKLEKFEAFGTAVSQTPRAITPPPPPVAQGTDTARLPSRGTPISLCPSALDVTQERKASHVRSVTGHNAPLLHSLGSSITVLEGDTDEDLKTKPQLLRKKSGEIVRPVLRPSPYRRPSNMPNTHIFSKAVHFDSHLEHVRHFLQIDQPLTISARFPPADYYGSDNEHPFPGSVGNFTAAQTTPYEWESITPRFSQDSAARSFLPIKLEKVWLSSDQKNMLGSVAVKNLAFHKQVICRFTLNYWKTMSEVMARYSQRICTFETAIEYDRFDFCINLDDTLHFESKTLLFCIRYSVNGQEFWDNNSGANFQIDFRKAQEK